MFKSIIVVTGATGNQGNSTANFILNSPTLSAKYTVRAVSRSIDSPKMLALKSLGAELAQADLNDRSTLPAALKGASYAFLVTTTQYQGNTREIETRQAKAFCEEAITQGVKYVIFSSMSHPFKISNGALKNVEHFDDKAEIEEYIRTLPLKASFFAPASFMQNFETHLVPRSNGDGTYSISSIAKPGSRIPYIDITDTGKWVGAILAEPEKYEGKFFAAAEGFYTLEQAAEIISRVTGKTVTYKQLPDDVFKGFLRPGLKDALYEMWVFIRDYGYYGAEQEDLVQWAKKQAIGNLTSLEEFLVRENYTIE